MLFTNGTGTGKTFTGLGVVRRFVSQGKSNILIAAPSQKILSDWVESAKALGLTITLLEDTKDAGKGLVATTYANLAANRSLADRKWDLVVSDEAHYLIQGKDGEATEALRALRAITLHPDGDFKRASMLHRDVMDKMEALSSRNVDIAAKNKKGEGPPVTAAQQAEADAAFKAWEEKREEVSADVAANQLEKRPRALFLSATPFAYEKAIEWAQGYLFEYGKETGTGYNSGDGRDRFFMQHFGYSMRYNKLTRPDAKVDEGLMQRQFNTWLKKQGVLSGRVLDVEADYDRRFVLLDSKIGNRIDALLEWLGDYDGTTPEGKAKAVLSKAVHDKFDHLSRRYLLEAIKAEASVDYVKAHLAKGRKVVVFHDYKKGGGFNPFAIPNREAIVAANDGWQQETNVEAAMEGVVAEYNELFKDLIESDLNTLRSPIQTYQAEFPDVLLFNGDVPAKQRIANAAEFNDDATGPRVMLLQSAAGKEGISLHDTTGKHPRVEINLGLPTQPTTAIQEEGRIYRTGQVSDAMFRYFNTGTNWEKWAFATTIANRASAAENLAQGEQARALKDAFITAFQEADDYPAGMEGEGKGGKDRDKASNNALTEFDRAVAFYWGTEKKNARSKAREGTDYFATPEPVGLKMAEWAGIRPGDKALEPSAGHGAIARWFPTTAETTAIEPSNELASRLAMVFDGTIKQERFEDLNIVNKYDAIVMNPPFGHGGSTAIEHLDKAVKHLRDGGRVVALIPTGPAADKKFEKWNEETKGVYLASDIKLPTVTFERAGTTVSARIVVLDKLEDPSRAGIQAERDLSDIDDIKALFTRIEDMQVPQRPPAPVVEEAAAPARTTDQSTPTPGTLTPAQTKHSKTGADLFVARLTGPRLEREAYNDLAARAKALGGWYSSFKGGGAIPGFQFKKKEARDAFIGANAPKADPTEAFSLGDLGFFSSLRAAAANLKQEKGTAEQMLAMLRKTPGVKEDEIEWTGLGDYLKAKGSVTKADILAFLDANGVQVEETTLGSETSTAAHRRQRDLYVQLDALGYDTDTDADGRLLAVTRRASSGAANDGQTYEWNSHRVGWEPTDKDAVPLPARVQALVKDYAEALDAIADDPRTDDEQAGEAVFEQYTLPGGENYREVLLTLPHREKLPDDWDSWTAAEQQQYRALPPARIDQFRSGHFDQPNILAHVRLKDRTAADGSKVLFVEEIQSDWAQKGRRSGFKGALTPEERARKAKLDETPFTTWDQADVDWYNKRINDAERYGVPRAPFVEKTDAWASLALKRVMTMAVEGGYDAIAWTTGEQQAERYDLSKYIDVVEYELASPAADGSQRWEVIAEDKNGRRVVDEDEASIERIEELLGKDIAKRIANGLGKKIEDRPYRDWYELRDLNLKVGGEGMIAFYDSIVPKIAGNVVKKLGGKVETMFLHGYQSLDDIAKSVYGSETASYEGLAPAQREKIKAIHAKRDTSQPGMRITPAMREKIKAEGLPLFALTAVAGGKLDATFADLQERLKAVGIDDRIALELKAVITNQLGKPQPGARGRYVQAARTIQLAMYTTRKLRTLNHEVIHALKDLGVIRAAEWTALSKAALADAPLMTMIRKRYGPLNLPEAKIVEEAVAEKFAYWTDGTYKPKGFVATAFKRIKDFMEALRNAWQGNGFQSAEDIFQRIDSGEVGRREYRGLKRFTGDYVAPNRELLMRQYAKAQKALDAHNAKPMGDTNAARDEWAAELQKLKAQYDGITEQILGGKAPTMKDLLAEDPFAISAPPRPPKFNPARAAAGTPGGPPTFSNPKSEARWQEARKGVGSVNGWRAKLIARYEQLKAGFSRHYVNLPNEARFSAAREQLRAIEAAPQASKEEVVRKLKEITEGMSREDLDLFTRKVVLDDLTYEVEQKHALPFELTPGDVKHELAKIDSALAGKPELMAKVKLRRAESKKVADAMVKAGVLEAAQTKNPNYFRHQVLEYARARVVAAKTAGDKLKSPYWAKRHGSLMDINANYLEAEFEWMQKALMHIAEAKAIHWLKDSQYNLHDQTIANAKAHNARLVAKLLADDLAKNGYVSNTGRDTSPLNEEWIGFRQRIAYGLSLVRKELDAGNITGIPADLQRAAAGLHAGQGDSIFPFLSWLLDNNQPGATGAAMALKAINQRKMWTRNHLGEQYADPMMLDDLVKRGFAPEGYTTWQPDEGRLMFMAKTIPENVVERMLKTISKAASGSIPAEEMAAAFESMRPMLAVGGLKYQMVLPQELATTLNSLRDEDAEGLFDALAAGPTRLWKIWTLINPRRWFKYNFNNFFGDLDAVIAGNPKALKKLPRAMRELRQVMQKGKTPSDRYREAVERGVFDSGLTVQEIPDIALLSQFEHLTDQSKGRALLTPIRWGWGKLRNSTTFREAWFRYATYLDYVERLEAGESMETIGYGAANREMVDGINEQTIGKGWEKTRAALLARELVGDYGAISHFGKGLRSKVAPFWSWTEINFKRYWRLTGNAWNQGITQGFRTSGLVGASLGIRTSAYLAFRMAFIYGMVQLWNNLFHGDEEDELGAEERARMHLILGRDPSDQVVTLRLQGAFSDFLAWFGMNDAVGMMSQVEKGRASYGDVLTAVAKAPVNKLANGMTPVISAPIEAATGQKLWPDVFEPRQIRDRWRNAAQLFSVEHEYDLIFDKPSRGYGRSIGEAFVYRRDPAEASYNRMKGLAYDWERRERGEGGGGGYQTPRSQALYEWRQAMKFGDFDAERKAEAKLRELGVNGESRRRSIASAHPLGNLSIADRGAFLRSLTPAERQTLAEATQWYRETFVND
jgi:hypothetical protein